MKEKYRIVAVDNPEESAWGIIGRGVGSFNEQQAGKSNFKRICFALQTPDEEIAGGILCEQYWDWLYVDLLWVDEAFRGQGHGSRLLQQAEDEARKQGARGVYLDTFSFQAPQFYEKNGYHVFGELPDFPPGHQRYFYTKEL